MNKKVTEEKNVDILDQVAKEAAAPAAVADATEISGKNADSELSGKKVRVTFFEQEGDIGREAIFASINGYAYQIPRGDPVIIPVELLEIFENANTNIVETVQGGGTRERKAKRFSYQIHGAA